MHISKKILCLLIFLCHLQVDPLSSPRITWVVSNDFNSMSSPSYSCVISKLFLVNSKLFQCHSQVMPVLSPSYSCFISQVISGQLQVIPVSSLKLFLFQLPSYSCFISQVIPVSTPKLFPYPLQVIPVSSKIYLWSLTLFEQIYVQF